MKSFLIGVGGADNAFGQVHWINVDAVEFCGVKLTHELSVFGGVRDSDPWKASDDFRGNQGWMWGFGFCGRAGR